MKQLINITTVPIQYELRIQNARLEYKSATAEVEISRDKGGMTIKSRPVKLNIDSSAARNSVLPTVGQNIERAAQKGEQTAYEATAQLAQEGQLMVKAKLGDDVLGQILANRNQQPTGQVTMGFTPSAPVELNYEAGDLIINYEMDKLNFDLKVANGDFEFIPGDIELSITQHPEVRIEYVGGPIYVPPSADPNFEPLDVRA